MTVAYVPYEAAFDGRLTSTAKSLLVYLGGRKPESDKWQGVWCWESASEIARAMSDEYMHYTAPMISEARTLLLSCGYLAGARGRTSVTQKGSTIHHTCYRVVVRFEPVERATAPLPALTCLPRRNRRRPPLQITDLPEWVTG